MKKQDSRQTEIERLSMVGTHSNHSFKQISDIHVTEKNKIHPLIMPLNLLHLERVAFFLNLVF